MNRTATNGRGFINLPVGSLFVPPTIGYHVVISGFGLWLPGDERGTWSEAWDKHIGFYEPHMLHPGDPVRLRISDERMKHPRVVLNEEMIQAVAQSIHA